MVVQNKAVKLMVFVGVGVGGTSLANKEMEMNEHSTRQCNVIDNLSTRIIRSEQGFCSLCGSHFQLILSHCLSRFN